MYRWQRTRDLTARPVARRAATHAITRGASRTTLYVAVVLVLGLTAGCASQQAAGKGEKAVNHRNWDAAVYHYLQALAGDPDNIEYRMELIRARQKAAQEHFHRGQALRQLGRLMAAKSELEMAVQLDPTHQYAELELEKLTSELEILAEPGGAEQLAEIKRRAREAKVKPPLLDPQVDEPITLNFPQAKPVQEIYKAISKAYGFNVTFDPKLKNNKLAIELNDVTAERALELVMQASNHFYKVLDEHSIIIAEDTPQNRREYEDLVIKTFFLSNAEVKEVDKLLRSLIEARRLATNEQLNAISLRDTADKVAIAEKLIDISDKPKAEVLVDVELLQVTSSSTKQLGMNLSAYSYNLSLDLDRVAPTGRPGADAETGLGGDGLYLDQISQISGSDAWFVSIPSVIVNLIKSSGEAQALAQPQLRITEGEKASLVIGEQVPIPVTAFNTSQATGTGIVPITSFQYKDVGIKIDVEPRVHHNLEVTLKLTVEVSQLGESIAVGPSQTAIKIGTRTITTVIRLKNGESSLLAGLLRIDKSTSRSETPFLSDIPLLGKLFTDTEDLRTSTDLILTLTPHVIRFPDIREEDLAPVWVGTESRVTYGNRPRVESGRNPEGPFDRVQRPTRRPTRNELRRHANIPGSDEEPVTPTRRVEPTEEPPRGIDLVPGFRENSTPQAGTSKLGLSPDTSPLVVGLEPSLVSLAAGQSTELRIVATGTGSTYRLPIGLSYDAQRISIVDVDPAPGVIVAEQENDVDTGWLSLILEVGMSGGVLPQVLAVLDVQATDAGPVPLVFTSSGALTDGGDELPVVVDDGAVFVQEAGYVPETEEKGL